LGGPETTGWADVLGASFEAGLARDEEVAATDLAFSLRQDVDVAGAVLRSGAAWLLVAEGGASATVDEVGTDYVRVAGLIVRSGGAVLRSVPGPSPRPTGRTFLEVLGEACRSGAEVAVIHKAGTAAGRLVRVGTDHLAVRNGTTETVVGLAAVEAVRLEGYSASRGFSG
jgi:hypothetical protein